MTSIEKRLENVAIGADEAVNSAFGGAPDETLSGTFGRAEAHGDAWAADVVAPVVDFVAHALTGEKNHCETVAAEEALRRQETGQK